MTDQREIRKISILLFDGFDELDAVGPYEVLSRAAREVKGLSVELVTLEPQDEVVASYGLRLRPDGILPASVDLLVVPGGGWHSSSSGPSVRREYERGALPERLLELHRSGTVVAAVCTGAMLLAAAGLTEGRPAVTHHGAIEDLRVSGARVMEEARVVDDGELLSAGGVTSGIDLALYIVEREWGAELADRISYEMEYERRGPVHGRREDESKDV